MLSFARCDLSEWEKVTSDELTYGKASHAARNTIKITGKGISMVKQVKVVFS
jgi:hypothetical protein